ncbi:phosphorylcholine metabolism protein LicD and glycosyltransferase family 92 domain-containing protein [Chlorella virus XW01]|nr:phosphorylcholine metabolism protein LicD and glycosyltransferase family 92 domain-containing protein [Chlorella virus XW01]
MLLLIIIIIIIFILFNKKELFNINFFKITDKKVIKKVMDGLELIDKVFRKHNIYYTISFGTLLGAIRHKQMIPWDDDVDLLIWRKDIDKIMKLNDEFKKNGWILVKEWKLIKLYPFIDNQIIEYPFIDFFVMDIKDDKIVRCLINKDKCEQLEKKHIWYHKWFNFDKNLVIDTIDYKLISKTYNFNVKGPKEGIKLLKFWYGDDCLKICKTPEFNHITSKYEKPNSINCDELKSLFN